MSFEKFSKASSLLNVPYEMTPRLTFEKSYLQTTIYLCSYVMSYTEQCDASAEILHTHIVPSNNIAVYPTCKHSGGGRQSGAKIPQR